MPIIDQQVQFVKQKLAENPGAVIGIATYTAEEFAELRRGEDYNEFKRSEREFAEALCRAGVPVHNIAFVEIDSVGYYRFIAEKGMELGDASRSAYAAYLLNRGVSK